MRCVVEPANEIRTAFGAVLNTAEWILVIYEQTDPCQGCGPEKAIGQFTYDRLTPPVGFGVDTEICIGSVKVDSKTFSTIRRLIERGQVSIISLNVEVMSGSEPDHLFGPNIATLWDVDLIQHIPIKKIEVSAHLLPATRQERGLEP